MTKRALEVTHATAVGRSGMPLAGLGAAESSAANGPVLGDADFRFLREFVLEHCGIALGEHKRQLVQGRLLRRLRSLGLSEFASYCERLRTDPDAELGDLASAISTNVTSFFREVHHYDFLADTLLPQWLQQKRSGERLRIWSAGCSTGEEPYALAMVLAEVLEKHPGTLDTRILAT
ncbi:CheR family methyltransferase, partial [Dyella silvatica]|uniref:CheR family methyltransferase n=1 Tax=Dyella silvatica TaxID=2992128 RepID=UPI002B1CB709